MKIFIYRILILLLLMFNCGDNGNQPVTETKHSLELKWQTANTFNTPVSVCYDQAREIVFVLNVNRTDGKYDNYGYISKLSLEGEIIELKWLKGLNGPKEMCLYEDNLYVIDMDGIWVISINYGISTGPNFLFSGVEFLKDICSDKNGKIYMSDPVSNKIYYLNENSWSVDVWLQLEDMKPKGLYAEYGSLLVGTDSSILSIDLQTKEVSTLITGTGIVEELDRYGNGYYFISDLWGKVQLVNSTEKILLIDNNTSDVDGSDIEYISNKKLLLIPTLSDNKVSAFELKE